MIGVPSPNYVHIMHLFYLILQYRQRQRISNKSHLEFQNISYISIIFFPLLMDWISMFVLIIRYVRLRSRIKKTLFKPHLLLRILAGYRALDAKKDLWNLLQNNWTHFFWLTGETPHTLLNIVEAVERIYFPITTRGRKTVLDLKNQVRTSS